MEQKIETNASPPERFSSGAFLLRSASPERSLLRSAPPPERFSSGAFTPPERSSSGVLLLRSAHSEIRSKALLTPLRFASTEASLQCRFSDCRSTFLRRPLRVLRGPLRFGQGEQSLFHGRKLHGFIGIIIGSRLINKFNCPTLFNYSLIIIKSSLPRKSRFI